LYDPTLLVRDCYKDIIKSFYELRDKTNANERLSKFLTISTPGIGKSAFLLYLLADLVREAQRKKAIITVIYSEMSRTPVHYFLSSDGHISLYGNEVVDSGAPDQPKVVDHGSCTMKL
jgi:replicative DNA helicase